VHAKSFRKPSQGRSEGNARDLKIRSVSLDSMLPMDVFFMDAGAPEMDGIVGM
jgi:hypothetical protein